GVGGLAVALALQDTLTNLFAGFYIIAARKIKPGDYIELESGQEGFVEDVSWRNTTIRTLQNYIIIVPNATLANVILTNYQLPVSDLAILMNVGVSYDSDLELVEKVTVEVAKEVMVEVAGAVPEFDPFIRYNDFAASSINFTVIMRGKQYTDRYLINHEFVKRLHKRYAKEGVEFPFPQLDLTIKNKEITVKQK
ncbi:mechanosensitive ion channel, partial [Candidatus Dojkabacteria bacterium]|nr:mechanosensitive ion channel [Candidatus Dojkabacteria bacterium]